MKIIDEIQLWFHDRLPLSQLRDFMAHKTVPVHRHNVFYFLGGMTLFFFLIQVATGILLMLYYRPSADEAFESVEFIMTVVPFGWLIRSIHSWAANLLVFFAFLHLVTVYFMKAYRPPRELTWITGCLLLFLIMGFGFSGYLLPWNQLAFFATKVGTDIAGSLPVIGEWLLRFLRGGDRVTGGTLSRFYGLHVAILPLLTVVVLGLHLLLVQIKGMSVPPHLEEETKKQPPMRFFPHYALRDLFGWILALGVLAALAALFPWELGEKADPFAPAYENIRPEWYFVFMFQALKLVPGGEIFGIEYEGIVILLFSLGGLVLLLIPFLDRGITRNGRSPLFTLAGWAALAGMLVMTIWGYGWSLVPLYIVLATILLLLVFGFVTRQRPPEDDDAGSSSRRAGMLILLGAALLTASASNASSPPTSCETCHSSADLFGEESLAIARHFQGDVHSEVGLSCHHCHGGNPDPALAGDMAGAMDESYAPNPYKGAPKRGEIPESCGSCHSSPVFMRRYKPDIRVDQLQEYWTSHHGQALRRGDANVATCVDCHGVHGILRTANPQSPVYPTRVAETCGHCHSDPKRMAGYRDDHGRALPVDQVARWKRSVHAASMHQRGDLSSPTCNDCHGNHGATPPGVDSVAFVCGQCHGRETELFRQSGKQAGFATHNDLIETSTSCNDCHDSIAPEMAGLRHFGECVTCHENHAVIRPTIAMLGSLPETPCALCHEPSTTILEPKKTREHYAEVKASLLAAAGGLQGNDRFDWLVDQALRLPTHTIRGDGESELRLRPEFARLFEKFRIGKTHYTWVDPVSGREIRERVRQCSDCHTEVESKGMKTARGQLAGMRQVIGSTARAERILLAAKRGGVEVRAAQEAMDGAVNSQIELEVLVHAFDMGGAFQEKLVEGNRFALEALQAGEASLRELRFRRGGLLGALGVILLVLVALALTIRRLGNGTRENQTIDEGEQARRKE